MTTDATPVMPLPPARRTLPAMLQFAAERFGDRPLLQLAGTRWSHRDAADLAARRAAALQDAGVGRGDRVALLCGNRAELLEVFLGCGWLGVLSVPINTASMGPQIGYGLADSGARLLVIEVGFLERLALVDLAATGLQTIWIVGASAPAEAPAELQGVPCRAWPVAREPVEHAAVAPGDALAILYTSGTSGPAKGVLCPHAQYHWWGVHSAQVLGVTGQDVLCTTLPLFHINALNTFAQALLSGAQVAYLWRFSASGFWPEMVALRASVVYLLGAMVPMLLAQPESTAERQHRVRIGLGPGVPAAASAAFAARCGVPLLEGYGSTETNFVIANRLNTPHPGAMGWLRAGFDARVVDEHDMELPPGQAGELVLRADEPFAFANGYHGMPDKTVEAWRNLWFHTGDRVVREADGCFRFIDRIKDAIRRRGENISAYEVEQVLQMHPAVASVAVYPVHSELAEDEVMAAVVVRDGAAVDGAGLVEFCQPRLPRFAVPRYIEFMRELPRTENGKVQKYRLRERGVTAASWERPGAASGQRSK
ncbi:MAG: AMP-binding protein [Ideonella sp.]|nr:AMP-binding protein [Ideonella sp.]